MPQLLILAHNSLNEGEKPKKNVTQQSPIHPEQRKKQIARLSLAQPDSLATQLQPQAKHPTTRPALNTSTVIDKDFHRALWCPSTDKGLNIAPFRRRSSNSWRTAATATILVWRLTREGECTATSNLDKNTIAPALQPRSSSSFHAVHILSSSPFFTRLSMIIAAILKGSDGGGRSFVCKHALCDQKTQKKYGCSSLNCCGSRSIPVTATWSHKKGMKKILALKTCLHERLPLRVGQLEPGHHRGRSPWVLNVYV